MPTADRASTLSDVIARNLRRIRGDVPTGVLERQARQVGAPWGQNRIAEMERGVIAPTVENLVLLAAVLSDATGRDVHGVDLLKGEPGELVLIHGREYLLDLALSVLVRNGPQDDSDGNDEDDEARERHAEQLREHLRRVTSDLAEAAQQQATEIEHTVPGSNVGAVQMALLRVGRVDERAAKRAHLSVEALTAWAVKLWGRTLAEERDRRAEPGANAQRLGRITRELLDEIARTIGVQEEAAGNGDD